MVIDRCLWSRDSQTANGSRRHRSKQTRGTRKEEEQKRVEVFPLAMLTRGKSCGPVEQLPVELPLVTETAQLG